MAAVEDVIVVKALVADDERTAVKALVGGAESAA